MTTIWLLHVQDVSLARDTRLFYYDRAPQSSVWVFGGILEKSV